MKNRSLLFVVLQLMFVATFAQKITNAKIVGKWQFTQMALVSPKQGFIPTLGEKEAGLMRICMANYTFNEDGSVVLSEEYITKTGVNKTTWKLNADQTGIDITYYFTIDPVQYPANKNEKETFPWKIESVTATDLSLIMHRMFMVKLKKATK
ncbi:MAG: hypothetical protein KBG47_01965 [Bacteroidia bacterium]|jgi:hypothetical protein|nr:hypothetical protein [Sphingobacteriaceae bacterium]MBK7312010.1 hypothetical protein [Sphingobacteriaceae bacterium]MBK7816707.1 hypothetical protein [Sphingobacteriaceae bacterium]MBP9068244.1 hypothetical protein [Bacteroidia bacterium]